MRWLSTALLCCVAAAAIAADGGLQPIPPFGQRVTDLTGTLDAQQKQTLETQLEALEKSKGSRVAILVLPTTAPEDIAQYSIRVTDAWKLSRSDGTTHDGVLLTVAKDDHRVRIDVGRDLEGAIPDAANARIIREYITPKFRAGDFYGGIEDAVGALTKLINDEPLPPPLADEESSDGSGDIGRGIMVAWFAVLLLRGFFSFLPAGIRAPLVGIGTGVACWLISGSIILAIVLGVLGGLFGLVSVGGGGFVGGSGRGGFGGGGGFSGGGGGGFSGGSSGGFSGGGASGSW